MTYNMDIKTEQYIRELNDLKSIINGIDDEEIKSSLLKLFCVRVSGLVEVFLKTRISEYSRGKVPNEINHFLTAKFKDITNLKTSKLKDILSSFSQNWADRFTSFVDEHEQTKISLDSIIAQRHNIAHGQPSTLNQSSMNQYYDDILKIIRYLDTIIR